MQVKKLTATATLPTYGSEFAAGMDLYADFSTELGSCYLLLPGERKLFKTGIAVALPERTYGRIAPRSGLAYKEGIDVLAGVVDRDYRGDVGVILLNTGDGDVIIKHGDRIAQFIVTPYVPVVLEEVGNLPEAERGTGGFGSTGK